MMRAKFELNHLLGLEVISKCGKSGDVITKVALIELVDCQYAASQV